MRRYLSKILLWSWIVTLPISIIGGYLLYQTIDRTYTYNVRYGGAKEKLQLDNIARYEIAQLVNYTRAHITKLLKNQETALRPIHLIVPEANLATLQAHMPQSGFEYVKGRMLHQGKLKKVKVKYRGDTFYRWAWDKKSIRIKTAKKSLYEGIRSVNLLAPRSEEQLNNYLSYRLAKIMGILAPRTELVRLYLNGEDQGVHILVEQIKEITLRNASLMPGDIYRGEMIGKDRFGPGAPTDSLFRSAAVWDKVAVNNHFAESSNAPLQLLISLVQQSHLPEAQRQLSQIMDMKAWGAFSAFESLVQSAHTDEIHNWRIYFDPWRSQFVPIVWDSMGWHGNMRGAKLKHEVIANSLMRTLFQNGDFIRARSEALGAFFATGKDQAFLGIVSKAVDAMEREVDTDPYLKPAKPDFVKSKIRRLEEVIQGVLAGIDGGFLEDRSQPELVIASARFGQQSLDLVIRGKHPVNTLRLNLSETVKTLPQAQIFYQSPRGEEQVSLPVAASNTGASLVIQGGFLPNLTVEVGERFRGTLQSTPGVYRIAIEGLDPNTKILSAEVDRGDGWVPAQPVDSITPTAFSQLYAPVAIDPVPKPIIWSGEVAIEGHQILDQPLIIEPGTTVNLAPKATVVLKHRLTAMGTPEAPIRFLSAVANQDPWGAIVLSGRGADGSTLSHCEMSDGSGLKGDLFEYSAMLSIHDVKNVVISDCRFSNNHTVDDMVHAVYADIRFERVRFENALSDALDLDISTASISDSYFERSGNDAVDLMTTEAVITGSVFKNNGDKGISVGENSQLYAVNNKLVGNSIGVQSKDRSTAILLNQTFTNNKTALHAYKKNWRYGEGGTIFLAKSVVSGGEVSATAKKRSAIQIFDSYLEVPAKGKRVDTIAVDDDHSSSALHNDLLPNPDLVDSRLMDQLDNIPADLLEHVTPDRRGSAIDG